MDSSVSVQSAEYHRNFLVQHPNNTHSSVAGGKEGDDDESLYAMLARQYPLLGCPLRFYQDNAEFLNDDDATDDDSLPLFLSPPKSRAPPAAAVVRGTYVCVAPDGGSRGGVGCVVAVCPLTVRYALWYGGPMGRFLETEIVHYRVSVIAPPPPTACGTTPVLIPPPLLNGPLRISPTIMSNALLRSQVIMSPSAATLPPAPPTTPNTAPAAAVTPSVSTKKLVPAAQFALDKDATVATKRKHERSGANLPYSPMVRRSSKRVTSYTQ